MTFRDKPKGHVEGAKPGAFIRWLFAAMGCVPGDTLDDLFPGSGAVGVEWAQWIAQSQLGTAA
jgi:hypothetical protein